MMSAHLSAAVVMSERVFKKDTLLLVLQGPSAHRRRCGIASFVEGRNRHGQKYSGARVDAEVNESDVTCLAL